MHLEACQPQFSAREYQDHTVAAGLLIAATLVFPAVACAGGYPTFEVTARDGRLSPEHIVVPAGQRVKLVLRNAGRVPVEFENLELHVEKVLAPGAKSFVIVPALRLGSYRFVDEFHPDTGNMQLFAR